MDGDASGLDHGARAAPAKCRGNPARGAARVAGLLVALAWLGAGCAGLHDERHLAPLFTNISTAGGGTETEALGGILRIRRYRPDGLLREWALRPLVIHDRAPDGDSLTRFLTPFGYSREGGGEFTWELLPVTRYHERRYANGEVEWQLLTLPGIYWSRQTDGRVVRAWFPFGGVMEHFLSYDRLVFVLFPIYMRTERDTITTYHVLWPIFSWSHSDPTKFSKSDGSPGSPVMASTGSGFKLWPIYGRSTVEGSYDRSFALWPIFHWQHNETSLAPDLQEHKWFFFPVVGHASHGAYSSTSVLWPFFGYAHDPRTGMWSWDGPWPLIRLHEDPVYDTRRRRYLPFYSTYHGDGLDSQWYLFPIVNVRHEQYEKAELDGLYVIPFWRSWRRIDNEAGVSSYEKFWPFYQLQRDHDQAQRFSFPALNPLWRTPEIEAMYAWMWELYSRERDHDLQSERSWLGLYRRERDADEDRTSVVGLWASRRYRAGGEDVHETSLLFGLIRWRSRPSNSLEWLWPAIPGPGWPLERAHAGELPAK